MTISQLERNVKAFDWYQDTPRMKTLFPFPIYRNLKRGNAINVQSRTSRGVVNLYVPQNFISSFHQEIELEKFEKFFFHFAIIVRYHSSYYT